MKEMDPSILVKGFSPSNITSDETHYGNFVCGKCSLLVSLDSVVTTACSHVYCRKCLETIVAAAFLQQTNCTCTVCGLNLEEINSSSNTIPSSGSMQFGSTRVAARPLPESQPLAFLCLQRVQVKCCSRENCHWRGDYQDVLKHTLSHIHSSPSPSVNTQETSTTTTKQTPTDETNSTLGAPPVSETRQDFSLPMDVPASRTVLSPVVESPQKMKKVAPSDALNISVQLADLPLEIPPRDAETHAPARPPAFFESADNHNNSNASLKLIKAPVEPSVMQRSDFQQSFSCVRVSHVRAMFENSSKLQTSTSSANHSVEEESGNFEVVDFEDEEHSDQSSKDPVGMHFDEGSFQVSEPTEAEQSAVMNELAELLSDDENSKRSTTDPAEAGVLIRESATTVSANNSGNDPAAVTAMETPPKERQQQEPSSKNAGITQDSNQTKASKEPDGTQQETNRVAKNTSSSQRTEDTKASTNISRTPSEISFRADLEQKDAKDPPIMERQSSEKSFSEVTVDTKTDRSAKEPSLRQEDDLQAGSSSKSDDEDEENWHQSINSNAGFWKDADDQFGDKQDENLEVSLSSKREESLLVHEGDLSSRHSCNSDEASIQRFLEGNDDSDHGQESNLRPAKEVKVVEKAEKMKKQANAKFNKGEFAISRALYSKAIQTMDAITPTTKSEFSLLADMYSNRSVTYHREKKFERSIKDCDAAIHYERLHEKSWIRKWRAMVALGMFDESYAWLKKAYDRMPNSKKIQVELRKNKVEKDTMFKAQGLMEKGEIKEAKELLRLKIRTSENVVLLVFGARIDITVGETKKAFDKIDKVLKINPKYEDAIELKGFLLFFSGETDKASQYLYEASRNVSGSSGGSDKLKIALSRVQKTHAAVTQARATVKRGMYQEAISYFTTAIKECGPLPPAVTLFAMLRTERAQSYLLSQQFLYALQDCQEAVNACREYAPAWVIRAEVMVALGKAEEAKKELSKVRKTWGAKNHIIEDGYRRVDFEIRAAEINRETIKTLRDLENGVLSSSLKAGSSMRSSSAHTGRHVDLHRSFRAGSGGFRANFSKEKSISISNFNLSSIADDECPSPHKNSNPFNRLGIEENEKTDKGKRRTDDEDRRAHRERKLHDIDGPNKEERPRRRASITGRNKPDADDHEKRRSPRERDDERKQHRRRESFEKDRRRAPDEKNRRRDTDDRDRQRASNDRDKRRSGEERDRRRHADEKERRRDSNNEGGRHRDSDEKDRRRRRDSDDKDRQRRKSHSTIQQTEIPNIDKRTQRKSFSAAPSNRDDRKRGDTSFR